MEQIPHEIINRQELITHEMMNSIPKILDRITKLFIS